MLFSLQKKIAVLINTLNMKMRIQPHADFFLALVPLSADNYMNVVIVVLGQHSIAYVPCVVIYGAARSGRKNS